MNPRSIALSLLLGLLLGLLLSLGLLPAPAMAQEGDQLRGWLEQHDPWTDHPDAQARELVALLWDLRAYRARLLGVRDEPAPYPVRPEGSVGELADYLALVLAPERVRSMIEAERQAWSVTIAAEIDKTEAPLREVMQRTQLPGTTMTELMLEVHQRRALPPSAEEP